LSEEEKPFKPSFGWVKSPRDIRDFYYRAIKAPVALPVKFSRRSELGAVRDQGIVGACVAFACCVMKDWQESKEQGQPYDCSERFIYARRSNIDSEGMWPHDAMDILLKAGTPPETMCKGIWYPPTNGDRCCDEPETIEAAVKNKIKMYARVYTVEDIKQAIFQDGIVPIGVPVFNDWVTGVATLTGHIPMPAASEGVIGYHMIAATGWDDETQELEFRNSWYLIPGLKAWGDGGNGYLPYAYWNKFMQTDWVEGYTAVDDVGPPPTPPNPWDDFAKCAKAALNPLDIRALLECFKKLLRDLGYLGILKVTKLGFQLSVKKNE